MKWKYDKSVTIWNLESRSKHQNPKTKKHKTNKPRNKKTKNKKPRTQEAKKPRHFETKKPRNHETKRPNTNICLFSSTGIPSTPQHTDSHLCTWPPSWGTRGSLGDTSGREKGYHGTRLNEASRFYLVLSLHVLFCFISVFCVHAPHPTMSVPTTMTTTRSSFFLGEQGTKI